VEIINDPDILGKFTIDTTNPAQYKTFVDSSDGKTKVIVHIPKNYNFKNLLVTHNTCDIYIRPKFIMDDTRPEYLQSRMSGLFISRVNTDEHIGQITHNDFYISTELINSYKNKYGLTDVTLNIVVRRAGKNDILTQERNYIEMLYMLEDDEILQFLSGSGDPSFPFWKADVLANSGYSKTLYQLQKPEVYGDLSMYLKMFGYLNCLNLACRKVAAWNAGQFYGGSMLARIPVALLHAKAITCIPTIGGRRLNPDEYVVKRMGNELAVDISADVSIAYQTGMAFEIFEDIEPRAELFTPTSGNNKIEVEGEVLVYRVRPVGTFTKNLVTTSYQPTNSYQPVTTGWSITTSGDKSYATFTSGYNIEYLVVSKYGLKTVHKSSFTVESLNGDVISTKLMTTTCRKWTSNATITIPVLWNANIVYLNGRELADPIDYVTDRLTNSSGYLIGYAYHITGIDHLHHETNTLEVVTIPDMEVAKLNDFSHNNTNDIILSTLMWYNNISMLTADGLPVNVEKGTTEALFMAGAIPGGALLHTRIALPRPLVALFEEASSGTDMTIANDMSRLQLIQEFLKQRKVREYKLSKIDKSHNLYSIVLALIMRDYLKGTLSINPNNSIPPQVTTYTNLSSYDLLMQNNTLSIVVSGSNVANVDGTYTINNLKGTGRIWSKGTMRIAYSAVNTRWELRNNTTVLYKTTEIVKNYDPWLLIWESVNPSHNIPELSSDGVDLRYIDGYPTYRHYDVNKNDIHKYKVLRQVMDELLPTDQIQDGVTIR